MSNEVPTKLIYPLKRKAKSQFAFLTSKIWPFKQSQFMLFLIFTLLIAFIKKQKSWNTKHDTSLKI